MKIWSEHRLWTIRTEKTQFPCGVGAETQERSSYENSHGRAGDAAALLAIYAPYVRETAITFEYDVPSEKEFAGRIAHTLEKFPYLVAENDGESSAMRMRARSIRARPISGARR